MTAIATRGDRRTVTEQSARTLRVDEESGVIRNVKILGRHSLRGRRYTDQAMQDAARLYEGVAVNFDHPDERHLAAVRGFFDQIGRLRNCRVVGDGVYGDLEYLKSHPGAPMLVESAKRFPNLMGLSHNADGPNRRDPDGTVVVEGLTEVRGVDIVTRPATNKGLFESREPQTRRRQAPAAPQGRRPGAVRQAVEKQLLPFIACLEAFGTSAETHDVQNLLTGLKGIEVTSMNDAERKLYERILTSIEQLLGQIGDRVRSERHARPGIAESMGRHSATTHRPAATATEFMARISCVRCRDPEAVADFIRRVSR